MSSDGFSILHKPSGKWALFSKNVFIAEFPTLAEAQGGMELCIRRVEFFYDAHGDKLDE